MRGTQHTEDNREERQTKVAHRFEAAIGCSDVQGRALVIVSRVHIDATLDVMPEQVDLALGSRCAQL